MQDKTSEFRQRLFEAEEMTPALQDAYHQELDAILHETFTPRTRLPWIVFLAVLAVGIGAIVCAMFVHHGVVFYSSAVTELIAFALAAAWIARDQWRGKFARKSSFKMADLFYTTAVVLTVLTLFAGMRARSDPASTFDALIPMVWLVTCLGWGLLNRIAAAELTAREQMLRIECRLADLAERLQKD